MPSQLPLQLQHLLLGADPATGAIVNVGALKTKIREGDESLIPTPPLPSPNDLPLPNIFNEHHATDRDTEAAPRFPLASGNGLGLLGVEKWTELADSSPLFTYKPLPRLTPPLPISRLPQHGTVPGTSPECAVGKHHYHSAHDAYPSPPVSADSSRASYDSFSTITVSPISSIHISYVSPTALKAPACFGVASATARLRGTSPLIRPQRPLNLPGDTHAARENRSPTHRRRTSDTRPSQKYRVSPAVASSLDSSTSNRTAAPFSASPHTCSDQEENRCWHQISPNKLRSVPENLGIRRHSTPSGSVTNHHPSPSASVNNAQPSNEDKAKAAVVRRASKACDRCRTHKIRCKIDLTLGTDDGSCGKCVQSGSACSYFKPRRKRGPACGVRI